MRITRRMKIAIGVVGLALVGLVPPIALNAASHSTSIQVYACLETNGTLRPGTITSRAYPVCDPTDHLIGSPWSDFGPEQQTTTTTVPGSTTTIPATTTTVTVPPTTTTTTTISTGPCTGLPVNAPGDISATNTSYVISGTHNWTIHPKSGDTICGGVLDGAHSTAFAIVADPCVTNVTLSGIEVRNYSPNSDARGAITTQDGCESGWHLNNLQVHDNSNAGAELVNGWVVTGGRYYNNRQEGLTNGPGDGFTVNGAELDHNAFADDTYQQSSGMCGHEAGGMKFVANNVTVENSNAHDNACMGIWADINSTGALITHNIVRNNWNSGIFWEVSLGAEINFNTVTGNGFQVFSKGSGCNPGWGGGIMNSDSGATAGGAQQATVDISNNDVEGNCNGITTVDNGPTGGSCGTECNPAHTHVHDNKVVGSTNPQANNNSGSFEWDGPPNDVASTAFDNTFSNNTYSGGINFCGNGC